MMDARVFQALFPLRFARLRVFDIMIFRPIYILFLMGLVVPAIGHASGNETLLERMQREKNAAPAKAVPAPPPLPEEFFAPEPELENPDTVFEELPAEPLDYEDDTRPARPLDWPPERYMRGMDKGDESPDTERDIDNFKALRVPLAEDAPRPPGAKRSVTFSALGTAPKMEQPLAHGQTIAFDQNAYTGYILGPGDKLKITVFGEDDLSGPFTVADSGHIAYPLLGDVAVKDLNVPQVREKLEGLLRQGYLKDPKIGIEVLEFRPFYITGEVKSPGSYGFVADMSVMNAVVLAGGFTFRADQDEVKIMRSTAGGSLMLEDIPTQEKVVPGDIILVEERFF